MRGPGSPLCDVGSQGTFRRGIVDGRVRGLCAILLGFGCGRVNFDDVGDASARDATGPGPNGPALWFRCNDASGTVLRDDGPGHHDAVLSGVYTCVANGLVPHAPRLA